MVRTESGGDGSPNSFCFSLDTAAASVLRLAAPLHNYGIWGRDELVGVSLKKGVVTGS